MRLGAKCLLLFVLIVVAIVSLRALPVSLPSRRRRRRDAQEEAAEADPPCTIEVAPPLQELDILITVDGDVLYHNASRGPCRLPTADCLVNLMNVMLLSKLPPGETIRDVSVCIRGPGGKVVHTDEGSRLSAVCGSRESGSRLALMGPWVSLDYPPDNRCLRWTTDFQLTYQGRGGWFPVTDPLQGVLIFDDHEVWHLHQRRYLRAHAGLRLRRSNPDWEPLPWRSVVLVGCLMPRADQQAFSLAECLLQGRSGQGVFYRKGDLVVVDDDRSHLLWAAVPIFQEISLLFALEGPDSVTVRCTGGVVHVTADVSTLEAIVLGANGSPWALREIRAYLSHPAE